MNSRKNSIDSIGKDNDLLGSDAFLLHEKGSRKEKHTQFLSFFLFFFIFLGSQDSCSLLFFSFRPYFMRATECKNNIFLIFIYRILVYSVHCDFFLFFFFHSFNSEIPRKRKQKISHIHTYHNIYRL